MREHEKVAVGGTFDFLHDGHKAILSKAFQKGKEVMIGLVSDRMRLKKDAAGIKPLEERRKDLEHYLEKRGWLERSDIRVIYDSVGPAADESCLEAIVVTEETRGGAEKINEIRKDNDLDPLEIIEIPLVLADDGKPISSIRIRYNEIDKQGNLISS
ncbi:MAG: phosphopantetheine adenylyltransferase [Candidatus Hadarchaeia archaeon]